MRVVMTGATGYVGRRVAAAMIGGGQRIEALVRSTSNGKLPQGATAFSGGLADLPRLLDEASAVDAIVHCAMEYDDAGEENWQADRTVIDCAAARNLRLIYTSSLFEAPALDGMPLPERLLDTSSPRVAQERLAVGKIPDVAVIRLGFVWGGGGENLWRALSARGAVNEADSVAIWPLVHVEDVADLFLRVLESGGGGVFHAADGIGHDPLPLAARFAERLLPEDAAFRGLWTRRIIARTERSRALGWVPRSLASTSTEDASRML